MPNYYAHSLDGKPPSDWQSLEEHYGKMPRTGHLAEMPALAFRLNGDQKKI